MHATKKIKEDLFWVGANDRRLALFENVFPLTTGMSYNSYLLLDDKTVLFDTVDIAVQGQLMDNLDHLLGEKPLDFIVVTHVEPDHCATLECVTRKYPEAKIVCNTKSKDMICNFFNFEVEKHLHLVSEGDNLSTGKHNLTFVMAPMVHWPEVMVCYDSTDKILFSSDAFGTFGALNGNIFADEVDFKRDWLDDARRYYTNIVGKYGVQVQALLKKASNLEINMICPLHGPVWREDISWYLEKYNRWSSYQAEDNGVLIAYGSIYGNTETAAQIVANKLGDLGVKNIKMFDVSNTHSSYILSEAFRCSHIVLASVTYNAGIFCNMDNLLHVFKAHGLQNKTVSIIENGSWAATSGKQMKEIIMSMKNMNILGDTISLKSAIKDNHYSELENLAELIYNSIDK